MESPCANKQINVFRLFVTTLTCDRHRQRAIAYTMPCQHSIARVMSLRELSGNIDKMTAYNQIRPLETTEAGFHSDQLPFLLFNQHPQITEQKSKYWQQPGKTSSGLHSFVVQQVTKGRNVKLHASSLMPVLTQFSLLTWTTNKQLTQCCHVGRKAV